MPHPEASHRLQTAVLWPASGFDAYGQPTIGNPIELKVRWVDKRREVLGPQGDTIATDVSVITNFKLVVGSVMWLGRIADLIGTAQLPPNDVCQVITSNATPDLKNRSTFYESTLMRLKDTLPNHR